MESYRSQAESYKSYLVNLGISEKLAKIAVAQSAHETAGWSSRLYAQQNNLFGMRAAKVRQREQLGEVKGYALYEDVWQSLRDYALYLQSITVPQLVESSLSDFIKYLKNRNYYEDSFNNYYSGVASWHSKLWEN